MQTNYRYRLPLQRSVPLFSNKVSPKKLKDKRIQEGQKKQFQRRIFGQHFNYSKVGLNKEKKYMIEEERNTEIERANRILLQKIKKIGQRSYVSPQARIKTQQINPQYVPVTTKKNFITRQLTPFRSTHHNNTPSKISQLPTPRRAHHQTKIIFKGDRAIDGVVLTISIYIEGNSYVIFSEHGNMEHKIEMSLDSYKMLLKESLDGQHLNIFQMLTFDGTLLQLTGTKRKQVSIIQEEELQLPEIKRPLKKNRSKTTPEDSIL